MGAGEVFVEIRFEALDGDLLDVHVCDWWEAGVAAGTMEKRFSAVC